jgi:hypothetical protein
MNETGAWGVGWWEVRAFGYQLHILLNVDNAALVQVPRPPAEYDDQVTPTAAAAAAAAAALWRLLPRVQRANLYATAGQARTGLVAFSPRPHEP